MGATKVNLADNNNNQTFTARCTLEQGIAGNEVVSTVESSTALEVVPTAESPITNEGLPTAESPTALEVVPTSESPITNEDVPTDEFPAEIVGEPTAESPTPRKSRDKRAIRRNSRNLLLALVHITN